MPGDSFQNAYNALNKGQREAVDTIEGPVMVIAGPGTGKTQVISLRIGKIRKETDTPADGILCLTFTNSGVEAMRSRLYEYIGAEAGKVSISTFHAFGIKLIEEFYHSLDLPYPPELLDTEGALSLIDRILSEHEWQHIRPRGNSSQYFRDLRSLVSLLIRERLSPEDFLEELSKDTERLKKDPDNISSRGASKGELKKEIQNKIESLGKTAEVVKFYEFYEAAKHEQNVMDYDDVLRYMVRLASESEDVRASILERYLYVLVDEHQDSSGVQNEFLKQVWGGVEHPNVFVVGDDRQLIYGFSGASLSYFEEFKQTFHGTKVITLTDNYRSTQAILDTAEALLTSSLAKGKLVGREKGSEQISLVECVYPRDEILSAGLFFKQKIAQGLAPEDCALLVPKNREVRSAAAVLRDLGLPVSQTGTLRLFDTVEARSFITILKIIDNPFSNVAVAESVLDPISGIPTLRAHGFLHESNSRKLSLATLLEGKSTLLSEMDPVLKWGKKLEAALDISKSLSVYELIQYIGKEFLLDSAPDHESFVRRVEIVRSLLHLSLSLEERSTKTSIKNYIEFLMRLEEYGEDIPLAIFGAEKGIRVMTLHGSKGLEFGAVWIAHMNERSLMSQKPIGFSLPDRLKELIQEKDEAAARREVYVAITRAKRFCTLSYAAQSHKGSDERLAGIIEALSKTLFVEIKKEETEKVLLEAGSELFVSSNKIKTEEVTKKDLEELVREFYPKKKVSVTLLNNFYDCPWKWYFRSFLDVPEPLSEPLEFGSVVHAVIESLLLLNKKPTKKEIDTIIKREIEDCHIVDSARAARMTKDAEKAVSRFCEELLPDLYDRCESEKPLSVKEAEVPKLTINGKIDLVEYQGKNNARVTDFKTGKNRKASEIEKLDDEDRMSSYMRQLAMYSYLLNRTTKGDIKIESSRLYFIETVDQSKALYETRITIEHINLLLKDIKDYDALMQSGEWTSRVCNHKPYPNEPDCPYCEKAKMYK